MTMWKGFLAGAFVLGCMFSGHAEGIFRVDAASTAATPDGQTWPTAYRTLQAGVDAASDAGGGEVWGKAGVYISTTGTSPVLTMKSGVSLYGGFAGTETALVERNWSANPTAIEGENLFRCVLGADDSVLDGFIVTHGYISEINAGGGMYNDHASPTVTNCAFVGNSAFFSGGAIANGDSHPTLTNCVFTGNSAKYGGGAMTNSKSFATLVNCTFTGNSSLNGPGGAILNWSSSKVVLNNCILLGDPSPTGHEIYDEDTESSSLLSYSCIQGGGIGTGIINTNPLFVDAQGACVQLRTGSPCIDAGSAAGALSTDFLGAARLQGAGIDMGAYEGAVAPGDLVTLTMQVSPTDYSTTFPSQGAHSFVRGGHALLLASGSVCRSFAAWSGDLTATSPLASMVMDGNKAVTANFLVSGYVLKYAAGTHGSLTGEKLQLVPAGESGTAVQATAEPGWRFDRWSDGVTDAYRQDTNVAADISVTAQFVESSNFIAGVPHSPLSGSTACSNYSGGSYNSLNDPYGAQAGYTGPNPTDAGSIPIFSLTPDYDNPVTSWPAAGAWDFCAAFDTTSCSLNTLSPLDADIPAYANLYLCGNDMNGPLNTDPLASSPLTPNGIPDGEFELGLLAAVLNNTYALDPAKTGGITNAQVLTAFKANFNYFKVLLTTAFGNVPINPPPSSPSDLRTIFPSLAPWLPSAWAMVLAGYATEGDTQSPSALDALLDSPDFFGLQSPTGGVEAHTTSFSAILGSEGDADRDGFTNRQEYDHFKSQGAVETIAAQLNPAVTPLTPVAPVFTTCAADRTVSADDSCRALVPDFTVGVAITDNYDSSPTVTQSPAAFTLVGVGETTVTLSATDNAGNVGTCTAKLTVTDTTIPVITRVGEAAATVECGGTYTDAGATASDVFAGDLTASIVAVNPVDTAVIGTYTVTYSVDDGNGNDAVQVTRTVEVVDTTQPVITLLGAADVALDCGQEYTTDAGATAFDLCSGDLTASIGHSGMPPTGPLGSDSWTVSYNVSDGTGNDAVAVSRTVSVRDNCTLVVDAVGDTLVHSVLGERLQISVAVKDAVGPVNFLWRKENATQDGKGADLLPHATENPLVIDPVTAESEGRYVCAVSDAVTTVDGPIFTLAAPVAPVPAAGAFGLVMAAAALGLGGVTTLRRRR